MILNCTQMEFILVITSYHALCCVELDCYFKQLNKMSITSQSKLCVYLSAKLFVFSTSMNSMSIDLFV